MTRTTSRPGGHGGPLHPAQPRRTLDQIRKDMIDLVIRPPCRQSLWTRTPRSMSTPPAASSSGGPQGDTGLTGRKIIVDTYGGSAPTRRRFSGKDPTKVDRSAAYAARWVAKNVVAAGLASRCQVQLAYAIGVAQPVSVRVDTFGTGRVSDEDLSDAVQQVFDLRPAAIIRDLDLRRPIYRQTAAYGHFGRSDLDLPWERTDRTDACWPRCRRKQTGKTRNNFRWFRLSFRVEETGRAGGELLRPAFCQFLGWTDGGRRE